MHGLVILSPQVEKSTLPVGMASPRSGNRIPIVKVELKRVDPVEMIGSRSELASAPFIKALGKARAGILSQSVIRRYPDTCVVMQQGDMGHSLFLVLEGGVRIFARRDTDSAELGVVHCGEVFGESEVLTPKGVRRCSAVAQGQVDVMELSKSSLLLNGHLPADVAAFLQGVQRTRVKALDEMSDFLNRW